MRPSLRHAPLAHPPFRDAVSIIVPAYNAEATLNDTVESALGQTHPQWEAIIVDDGSTDGTAALGATWAARDSRIACLHRPHAGVSAARNAGIGAARFDWLLFLDADDLIRPTMIERTLAVLAADPTLDAAYCGWGRLTPGGTVWDEQFVPPERDMFKLFGRWCAIHTSSCLVRRDVVEEAGGFDASLVTCQDWDVWQRISRTGARFGGTKEILSLYRVRPGSASFDSEKMIANGLRVIETGHSSDPRVLRPVARHLNGLPVAGTPLAKLCYICWVAGFLLGRLQDARSLLAHVERGHMPELDRQAHVIANIIFPALLMPDARAPHQSYELWPAVEPLLHQFLLAVEELTLVPELAARVERLLEGMVPRHSPAPRPLTVVRTHAIRVEITEPVRDVSLPGTVERLLCDLALEGEPLGSIELPVFDGLVPGDVIVAATAREVFWPVLRRCFERTIYPGLRFRSQTRGVSVWRGNVCLAEGLRDEDVTRPDVLHERIGWTVFLQELWGRPEWPSGRFYDATAAEPAGVTCAPRDGWVVVETSTDPPDVQASGDFRVLVEVGGVAIGVPSFTVRSPRTTAQALRAAITREGGLELARAAVREGLLGRSLHHPGTLRERLAAAASIARAGSAPTPLPPADSCRSQRRVIRDRHHYEARFATAEELATGNGKADPLLGARILALLPPRAIRRALEIGCADGRLTVGLASRVERLVSVDISRVALARAAARCRAESNARFLRLDLLQDPLPGRFDLVICNALRNHDVDLDAAGPVAAKLAAAVEPDGLLLLSTSPAGNVLTDPLGQVPGLRLLREVRSPPQRIYLYQRDDPPERTALPTAEREQPEVIVVEAPATEDGGQPRDGAGSESPTTDTPSALPILMYHRIAPAGLPSTQWCRVHPGMFAQHLRALDEAGFYTVSLETWADAVARRRPLPGRPMVLTFDDGCCDFAEHAWPLLRRHGFRAVVFLVASFIGKTNEWDSAHGESIPLLDWEAISRLRDEGVEFGSHTVTHRHLNALAPADVAYEAAHSRMLLERGLDMPVRSIAYPFGDTDPVLQQIVGTCGYRFGVSCRCAIAQPTDDLLELPRIGVGGLDDFHTVIERLGG